MTLDAVELMAFYNRAVLRIQEGIIIGLHLMTGTAVSRIIELSAESEPRYETYRKNQNCRKERKKNFFSHFSLPLKYWNCIIQTINAISQAIYGEIMRYKKVLLLIFIALVFSGCIVNEIIPKVDVVHINVSVAVQDNKTVITGIEAKGETLSKLNSPGIIFPEKFPAIYAEVLQVYGVSKPAALRSISRPNGQIFKGPGNYSFTVELYEKAINKSQPIIVYSEIADNSGLKITSARLGINWTE